jgi:broad specificity phosphatase PhoE
MAAEGADDLDPAGDGVEEPRATWSFTSRDDAAEDGLDMVGVSSADDVKRQVTFHETPTERGPKASEKEHPPFTLTAGMLSEETTPQMRNRNRTSTAGTSAYFGGESPRDRDRDLTRSFCNVWEVTSGVGESRLPRDPGTKLVHFVRHGEGTHNVMKVEGKRDEASYLRYEPNGAAFHLRAESDAFVDCPLTELGENQARSLHPATRELQPELLVCSSLQRTRRTALLAFEGYSGTIVAHDDCREWIKSAKPSVYNKHRGRSRIQAEVPKVDCTWVLPETQAGADDPMWWEEARLKGETEERLVARAERFITWLWDRPESEIAVVSHSGFLQALLRDVLFVPEQLSERFGVGEMRSMKITRLTLPWDEAARRGTRGTSSFEVSKGMFVKDTSSASGGDTTPAAS